ncbi:cation:proton antiporter [Agromyces archimandritae]|uniref:Sodium:proton antiporter n=1 Tax=Agromyces archimandritae TaxID=2781962 RepID=A0A975IPM4_9MICO|nr:sodium:proton antiporter [Agromyces archimandritae]QTX04161.1 sodium:proton antiporter [Agromyces archimandritae]
MEPLALLLVGVVGVLVVAAATVAGNRLQVAAPLLLVVVGALISLVPAVPEFVLDPEWILAGILPPLLYSTAVSMPAMEFRRDFRTIGGLSVLLVVVSSLVLGLLFDWLIPGVGLATGIALGAIVSPTDAVATQIAKRLGVSPRAITVLEGESLLNDATALVLLRTAIAAAAAAVSFWEVIGQFVYAVAIAVAIGLVVGWLNLVVRHRVRDAAVNTAISFTVPFLAAIPAEELGASGLVAAVTAGLVTGNGAARYLRPEHRISDAQNWRLVELLLEGAVFLVMGLEIQALIDDVREDHSGVGFAALLALFALAGVLLVRAAYVAPLVWGLSRRSKRAAGERERLELAEERIDRFEAALEEGSLPKGGERRASKRDMSRIRARIRRMSADLDYLEAAPLGWREGTIVVWAGMRGAVTLAAAQTLPTDTPSRSLMVLVAFFVAAASLLLQGGTLPWLARRLGLTGGGIDVGERARLSAELGAAAREKLDEFSVDIRAKLAAAGGPKLSPESEEADGEAAEHETAGHETGEGKMPAAPAARRSPSDDEATRQAMQRVREARLAVLEAQREALHRARRTGVYGSETLTWALNWLDAEQISIELRTEGADESGAAPA